MNQSSDSYGGGTTLMYPSPAVVQSPMNYAASPMVDSPWHTSQHSPQDMSLSEANPTQLPSPMMRSPGSVNYESYVPTSYPQPRAPDQYVGTQQQQPPNPPFPSQSEHEISFAQVESSVGPIRAQPRRKRVMQSGGVGQQSARRASLSSPLNISMTSQGSDEVRSLVSTLDLFH
jgi:hypothetical protein